MSAKRRSQPRLKHAVREPLPACVLHEVRAAVSGDAKRYQVSRSWIVAVIVADHYGIHIARYDDGGR